MKKILVFDVAASARGAMSVLKSFYNATLDTGNIEWVYILSDNYLPEAENIRVMSYPKVKTGWLKRLWFDYVEAPKIVRKENPEVVLSLQNTNIPFIHKQRVTFLHQSIPFSDISFSIKTNRIEWVYQHIISRLIFRSLKNSDIVVVQTEWMKNAVIDRLYISENKMLIVHPSVDVDNSVHYDDNEEALRRFFYPSAYANYKNHEVIFEAIRLLNKDGIRDFRVRLTIRRDEVVQSADISEIDEYIEWLGNIPFADVLKMYADSVVLFPSQLETFGLPLAEAGIIGSRIIVADKPYSRELLKYYPNAL